MENNNTNYLHVEWSKAVLLTWKEEKKTIINAETEFYLNFKWKSVHTKIYVVRKLIFSNNSKLSI